MKNKNEYVVKNRTNCFSSVRKWHFSPIMSNWLHFFSGAVPHLHEQCLFWKSLKRVLCFQILFHIGICWSSRYTWNPYNYFIFVLFLNLIFSLYSNFFKFEPSPISFLLFDCHSVAGNQVFLWLPTLCSLAILRWRSSSAAITSCARLHLPLSVSGWHMSEHWAVQEQYMSSVYKISWWLFG